MKFGGAGARQLDFGHEHELKRDCRVLNIVLNGGIASTDRALTHLEFVDGVMIGRRAYHEPYFLTELEQALFPNEEWQAPSRHRIIELMTP